MEPLLRALMVVGVYLGVAEAIAKPRTPLPPIPEMAPVLWHEDFDELYSYTNTSDQISVPGFGELVAGGSGYALQRSGMLLSPLIVPGLDSGARPLLATNAGAIRFWLTPYWSSTSVTNGTGPGIEARLVEFAAAGNNQVALCWSLQVSPDGNALALFGQTDAGSVELLRAGIAWQANQPHLLCLDYGSQGTALLIDGQLCAVGASTLMVPPQTGRLVLGSTFAGTEAAECAFDEIYTFGRPLGTNDLAFYYGSTRKQAALGPITEEELAARRAARLSGTTTLATMSAMEQTTASGPPAPEDDPAPTSEGASEPFPPAYNYPSNSFWVEMVSATNNLASVVLHGTVQDMVYEILSRETLTNTGWISEGTVLGASGQNWTPATITIGTRTNSLFLCARSWMDNDGNGLPDWWELQYFSTVGVDAYDDPDKDGWSNIQEYQNGTSPNSPDAPPVPQGLAARINPSGTGVIVTWIRPSPSVTGYTITRLSSVGDDKTFSVSADAESFEDTHPVVRLDPMGTYVPRYQIEALYASGKSAPSEMVVPYGWDGGLAAMVRGPLGRNYVVISTIPQEVTRLRLSRYDYRVPSFEPPIVVDFDVALGSFTNGVYLLPDSWAPPLGYSFDWMVQTLDSHGNVRDILGVGNNKPIPFFDGREQLKQNLNFLLRAANGTSPFAFTWSGYLAPGKGFSSIFDGTSYAYAGLDDMADESYSPNRPFGPFEFGPFTYNALYRNFVFTQADAGSHGQLTGPGLDNDRFVLNYPSPYLFQPPTTLVTIPSLLSEGESRWTYYFPLRASFYEDWSLIGLQHEDHNVVMAADARNYFGLPYLAVKQVWGDAVSDSQTVQADGSIPSLADAYFYPQTAQPALKTLEYYFTKVKKEDADSPFDPPLPGQIDFSPTNPSPLLIASVGEGDLRVAGYAKQAITNGNPTKLAFLGQYFATALKIDGSGAVTTNQTGVLSEYGEFFPTEPGPTALVTMPDLNTGERGTGVVNVIKLQLDVNHDGNMDLSYSGPDNTSWIRPFVFWINNDYDRGHTVDGSDWEEDDLASNNHNADCPGYAVPTPDYAYAFYAPFQQGAPAIPSMRDLEDYTRLWLPGLASLRAAMPTNYTVKLILNGEGQIRLFRAVEVDGGTNYLFDATTASNQVYQSRWLYVGLLTSSSPIILSGQTNFSEHFIWCGANRGSAEVHLQVLDGEQNLVADTAAYIELKDIKEMYERWTVGDDGSKAPASSAFLAPEDVTLPFNYGLSGSTNTPYILFVHGWNMERWEKDRFAEAAFKRLYWQGYQGRFGSFRWPTLSKFDTASWQNPVTTPNHFDKSEFNAWKSGAPLRKLLVQLNSEYPNQVRITAHSMGNIAAGEALRTNTPLVHTYVATQAAVASQAYDSNAPGRVIPTVADNQTFNYYAHYWQSNSPPYFNDAQGADHFVNFFNPDDYALAKWQIDQNLKPADTLSYAYWQYPGTNYFTKGLIQFTYLGFPADTHEIFSFCDEARCYALGMQADMGNMFEESEQINLAEAPYGFGTTHKGHSAQFRSTNMKRAPFWKQLLITTGVRQP